ncbi:hypothetical protein DUI87_25157 [Hirundo rustica rustica]|uniref:Uncharacterized protein n=1 Tax=Hirundo rustica rustica TaxID=333673 RepID=A0A3M0JBS2_HIRRU|nr:hypothetical protein DUI87_25157 [Hirundo rustica rustica]
MVRNVVVIKNYLLLQSQSSADVTPPPPPNTKTSGNNASSFCKAFYFTASKCFETIGLHNKNWVSSAFLILEMRTNRNEFPPSVTIPSSVIIGREAASQKIAIKGIPKKTNIAKLSLSLQQTGRVI